VAPPSGQQAPVSALRRQCSHRVPAAPSASSARALTQRHAPPLNHTRYGRIAKALSGCPPPTQRLSTRVTSGGIDGPNPRLSLWPEGSIDSTCPAPAPVLNAAGSHPSGSPTRPRSSLVPQAEMRPADSAQHDRSPASRTWSAEDPASRRQNGRTPRRYRVGRLLQSRSTSHQIRWWQPRRRFRFDQTRSGSGSARLRAGPATSSSRV
jgi:hypothetical protein